jgi:hypothetical protein
MMKIELPPLPEPRTRTPMDLFDASAGERANYSDEQMTAYALLAVEQERARCAELALAEKVDAEATGTDGDIAYNLACDHVAAAIRQSS